MTRRGWLWFVALGIIWGLPYLLIKISVREVSPPLLVLIRTGGGALLLVPLAGATGALRPALRKWRAIIVYSVVEMAVPWLLLFNAEKHLPSSFTGLMVAAVPLVAAVLAFGTGTDRVDLRRGVGLLMGLGGVGALVGFDASGAQLWSAAALAVVACGYALGPWIIAHHLHDVPPIGVMAWSFTVCAVAYSPAIAFSLPSRTLSASVIESVLGLTLVCTILAFLCFFALIAEVGAMRATLVTYVNPAVAVILGVTVLNETFNLATALGFVLILGGCLLATRPLTLGRGRRRAEAGPRTLDPEDLGAVIAGAPGGSPAAGLEALPADEVPGAT